MLTDHQVISMSDSLIRNVSGVGRLELGDDFFRIMIDGHFYLWLPPVVGKPVVASATLIFVFLLISGIILWWGRKKKAKKDIKPLARKEIPA